MHQNCSYFHSNVTTMTRKSKANIAGEGHIQSETPGQIEGNWKLRGSESTQY